MFSPAAARLLHRSWGCAAGLPPGAARVSPMLQVSPVCRCEFAGALTRHQIYRCGGLGQASSGSGRLCGVELKRSGEPPARTMPSIALHAIMVM